MKFVPRSALLPGLLLAATTLAALAQPPASGPRRELIYCADLMSHEERNAYRARMQSARTVEEKESLRASHRSAMQARARADGRERQCEPVRLQWRGGRER